MSIIDEFEQIMNKWESSKELLDSENWFEDQLKGIEETIKEMEISENSEVTIYADILKKYFYQY